MTTATGVTKRVAQNGPFAHLAFGDLPRRKEEQQQPPPRPVAKATKPEAVSSMAEQIIRAGKLRRNEIDTPATTDKVALAILAAARKRDGGLL